jgi:hypothetical protein
MMRDSRVLTCVHLRRPKTDQMNVKDLDATHFIHPVIGKSRRLTDVQPCPNKHVNMTSVAGPRSESRSVIHRDWKTFLRSSANNMLIRPQHDVPRANFAVDHCLAVRRSLLPVAADLVLGRRRNAPPSGRGLRQILYPSRAGKALS